MSAPEPALAVVLPTVGRSRLLLPLVDQILSQLGPRDEILIVDQSPPDERALVAARVSAIGDPRLSLLTQAERSLPLARNAGIAATTAEIVLFFDDDTEILPGCLDAHRAAYGDPAVGAVTGRIIERVLRPNAPRTVNRVGISGRIRVNLEGDVPCEIDSLKGANMSVRRTSLDRLRERGRHGPFDPAYGGTALLEESDLSARLRARGWRILFQPSAGVVHLHEPSGGVRAGAPDALWWRFHNTARYLRLHRGIASLLPFSATFSAIALSHAASARDLRAPLRLWRAARAGWRSAAREEIGRPA